MKDGRNKSRETGGRDDRGVKGGGLGDGGGLDETRQQGGESVWEKFVGRYLSDFNGGVAYEIPPSACARACVRERWRVSPLPFSHPLLVSSLTSPTFN